MSEFNKDELTDPEFWQLPLGRRMARFAELREIGPFLPAAFSNPLFGLVEEFQVTTRYAEVIDISRRPQDFCSGNGAVSDAATCPPRRSSSSARSSTWTTRATPAQRGIVARSFTPRQLQGVLDSVETICTEVIDDMCEQGEVDLVDGLVAAVPAARDLRHDGHPAQRVRRPCSTPRTSSSEPATPRCSAVGIPSRRCFEAGMQLTALMNEIAEQRRAEPQDDLTSALVHADVGEDMLAPNEIAPFFILLAVAGNDTTRTAISHGMHLLSQNPDQRRIWQDDLDGDHPDRGRGDRPRRVARHVHATHGDEGHDGVRPRVLRRRQGRAALRRGQPGPARVRRSRAVRRASRTPIRTWASAAPGRTSASAPTWLAGSWRLPSASCSPASPTSSSRRNRCRWPRWASRWSEASSTCRCSSPRRLASDRPRATTLSFCAHAAPACGRGCAQKQSTSEQLGAAVGEEVAGDGSSVACHVAEDGGAVDGSEATLDRQVAVGQRPWRRRPAGSEQSPPSSARNARSASTQRRLGPCSMAPSEAPAGRASSSRHSTASAAWPTCGQHDVGRRGARRSGRPSPRRSSAVAATTTASWSAALAEAGGHVAAQPDEAEVRAEPPPAAPGGAASRWPPRRPAAGRPAWSPPGASRGSPRSGTQREHAARGPCPTAGPWPSARRGRPARRAPRPAPPWRTRPCRRAPRWARRGAGRPACRRPRARPSTSGSRAAQQRGDVLGLPARQRAAPRRRPDGGHGAAYSERRSTDSEPRPRRRRPRGRRARAATR